MALNGAMDAGRGGGNVFVLGRSRLGTGVYHTPMDTMHCAFLLCPVLARVSTRYVIKCRVPGTEATIRVYLFGFFPNPTNCRKRNFGRNFAKIC